MRRAAEDTIHLNGSYGEGGGALFKAALAMSALTLKPCFIHSIRGATRKPGITPEDFAFLSALAVSTGAHLQGDDVGSRELTFTPKHLPRAIDFDFDITKVGPGKTPGNCLAVAQALAAPLARTGAFSSLRIRGETHNNNTLTFDAFELCTSRAMLAQGLGIYANLASAGFGYAARGECRIEIEPSALQAVDWGVRGEITSLGARITSCGINGGALTDAESAVLQQLGKMSEEPQIEVIELGGPENGLAVTLWAKFDKGIGSASACLNRGGRASDMVDRAMQEFRSFLDSDCTVDAYLADQILMGAALAEGKTTYSTPQVTRRLQTMAWIIKQFLPIAITIKGREGMPGTITVQR